MNIEEEAKKYNLLQALKTAKKRKSGRGYHEYGTVTKPDYVFYIFRNYDCAKYRDILCVHYERVIPVQYLKSLNFDYQCWGISYIERNFKYHGNMNYSAKNIALFNDKFYILDNAGNVSIFANDVNTYKTMNELLQGAVNEEEN